MNTGKTAKDFIVGEPFDIVPPRIDNPRTLTIDMRTAAIARLKQYLGEIIFYRVGGIDPATNERGAPIAFRIPNEDITIGWPDYEQELVMPSIVFLSTGEGQYNVIGIGPQVLEASRDVNGYGTVLQKMSTYSERLAIEIWTSKKSEERCILAGLEYAMNPTQNNRGLRFRIPEYYNSVAEFTFDSREIFDDEGSMRNRRRARVYVTMEFVVVALIKYNELITQIAVAVDSCNDGTPVDLSRGEGLVPQSQDANVTTCCDPPDGGELVPVDPDMRTDHAC